MGYIITFIAGGICGIATMCMVFMARDKKQQ